jgi:xanthine dehydrogenase accessory factor
MREVFATVARWLQAGTPCALGTLVQTFESSPAPVGTTIAVDRAGSIVGNIGAGCYESEIVQACQETIRDGRFRLLRINLTSTDEITGSTGCGGALKIAVWKPSEAFAAEAEAIVRGSAGVTVDLPEGHSFTIRAKRRLLVVGATTLAQEIARIASGLDFFTTVVDPRPPFATPERLPDAGEIVIEWPDEYLPAALNACAAVLIISHDPKFDLPALRAALQSNVSYIGLLGSRRSQAARRDSLREMGFGEDDLVRIHGPAGLDLGGKTAAETALSILAHVVAQANRRSAAPLDRTRGSIHASTTQSREVIPS